MFDSSLSLLFDQYPYSSYGVYCVHRLHPLDSFAVASVAFLKKERFNECFVTVTYGIIDLSEALSETLLACGNASKAHHAFFY